MKTFTFLLFGFYFMSSICNSQITQDYPFKTYLDGDNNLYLTGYENTSGTNDILIKKISHSSSSGDSWSITIPNTFGDDRGLDLAADKQGNTFITGFTYNYNTSSNDIIAICLNPNGTVNWSKILENPGDDKGMGISLTFDEFEVASEVYITGYITNPQTGKDFIIKKYDALNGASIWQYVDKSNPGDDIATDILLDDHFAYVLGYSYFNGKFKNDVVVQTYDLANGSLQQNLVDHRELSDEKPTAFVITEYSRDILIKSRIAVTSVTDNFSVGNEGREFTTTYFEPDYNNNFVIRWRKEYPCTNREAVTAISEDRYGDVYITGYLGNESIAQNYGYDFATIKYTKDSGAFGWSGGVKLYNHYDSVNNAIDDRASSIKVNNQDIVFVSGTSDPTPLGFSIVSYKAIDSETKYAKKYVPNFERNLRPIGREMNKWTTLHLANDGTPLMMVMSWDETDAFWSAVRYDENGNELYTINNEGNEAQSLNRLNQSAEETSGSKETKLTNYPNPFNPSTVISYSLSENAFVTLKVFDILGKEVTTLVKENQNPGNYNYQFSTVSYQLSSGIYYYQMSVNGVIKDTKRMMLVK